MPTIIKRGDKFLARVRRQGFSPVSQTFIRRTDAQAWGRRIEADQQSGKYVESERVLPTLKEAIVDYRAKVAIRLKGERDYLYAFNELEALDIAAKPVDKVSPADLARWRDALTARGLKPGTVVRRLGLLSSVLGWCHKEQGWLSANPMLSVRKPTVRDARTRTLDPEEVRYLEIATAAARAKWLPDAIILLMSAALRRSELVSLQCVDVDLSRSVAVLHDSKNGEGREVPLSPQAKAAMGRLIEDARSLDRKSLLPISDPEAVSFAFRRAVVRARQRYEEDCARDGRECDSRFMFGIRLHDLRHHSVSVWARTGGLSLFELMKVSGHKSPRMLARYAHLSSEQVAAKMATLSA